MIAVSESLMSSCVGCRQDLVKSHLMFAVREEVELLKEQIKDLTARNCHLQLENSILRASASPDTLAKLDSVTQPPAPPT